jgi:hypothetical protein
MAHSPKLHGILSLCIFYAMDSVATRRCFRLCVRGIYMAEVLSAFWLDDMDPGIFLLEQDPERRGLHERAVWECVG